MNAADIELARMVYLASSLAVLLFTSMILRGLWRPLRFVLLALTVSVLFTPFFVEQSMPDGSNQNLVPAVVVMAYNVANDREHWRESIQHAGKPIAVVSGITTLLALTLAILLPKPKRPPAKVKASGKEDSSQKDTSSKKDKPKKKKKKNPYLPDDFQPE
jgi:hypothetical protein